MLVGAGVIVGGLVLAWPLGPVFSIPYAALAMGIASVGFVVFGTGSLGIAQGREEHLKFSYGFLATGFGRAFSGSAFPPRNWPSVVTSTLAPASSIRSRSDWAEKPPNTTEWVAPIRAQACMVAIPSMVIGM